MMGIAVDLCAAALAQRIARNTGWRASEIYAWIIATKQSESGADVVDHALSLIVELRQHGESFKDATRRLADIAIRLEQEKGG